MPDSTSSSYAQIPTEGKHYLDKLGLKQFAAYVFTLIKDSVEVTQEELTDIIEAVNDKISSSEKGAANGVAALDSNGKVPVSQIPSISGTTYELTQDPNNGHILTLTGSNGTTVSVTIPDHNTTYEFDGSYDPITNKAATVSTVENKLSGAIENITGSVTGTPGAGKTVTSLSQSNGQVSAVFENISISKNQISDFPALGTAAAKNVTDNTTPTPVAANDDNLITARTLYNAGYTKNEGTITGVIMNGEEKGSSGIVDLGTVVTSHQDISGKADKTSTVTDVSYNTSQKTLTKTINGETTDIVSAAELKAGMSLSKADVGLGNVDNTADADKPVSSATQTALNMKIDKSSIGANSGVASLGTDGKVPESQLPSYVDDVVEYNKLETFPSSGEAGKIYVDLTTNKTYRWSGSTYVEVSASIALGETSATAFRGDYGKTAYDHAVAKGNAYNSGLYKITTNAEGHVTSATPVQKEDVTDLGIPGSDTTYTLTQDTNDGHTIIFTPSAGQETTITIPDNDTTYEFEGVYDPTTNKAATVSTVTGAVSNAIRELDGGTIGTPGPGKTITALSQTDGQISASFGDISITVSQVSDFPVLGNAVSRNVTDNTVDTPVSENDDNLITARTLYHAGYTKNEGTITGITMNNEVVGTSGMVDLGTILTEHQDISGKADKASTVSNVAYAQKKLTKTINGTTTDIVTAADLKADMDLSKNDVGLENVDNTSDLDKPVSTATQTALNQKVDQTLVGANSGIATLDVNGKVPVSQLPSSVNNVSEYQNFESFPNTGETGKIYIDRNTARIYRWNGSSYTEVSPSLVLGESSSTAFRGDQGKTAYDHATAKGSAFSKGLYKIATNAEGHVTSAEAVQKSDITALGIPGSNTTYTLVQDSTDGHRITFTPSEGTETVITIPDSDTHHVTGLYAGTGSAANAASENGNTKLTVSDDGTARTSVLIQGAGTTTVSSNASGVVTIRSEDSHKGTVTKISTGVGLDGGDITTAGTVKAKLRNETPLTNDSAAAAETAGRVYPVSADKSGYLAVNVPWENTHLITGVKGDAEITYRTGNVSLSPANIGAVPTTRKINTKVLSADITLSASDVGAVPTTRKVNNKVLSADITLSASDVGAVPTTRKVNNKALSADISLSASDVGAVPLSQGTDNAGKFLIINSSGNVEAIAMSVWQGGSY